MIDMKDSDEAIDTRESSTWRLNSVSQMFVLMVTFRDGSLGALSQDAGREKKGNH